MADQERHYCLFMDGTKHNRNAGCRAHDNAYGIYGGGTERDRRAADTLKPGDGQRIVRAREVLDASGRSILDWQAERGRPLIDRPSARFAVIEPDRAELVARIDRRFDAMIDAGALDEVKALAARGLDPKLPAMKAIGVPELTAVLEGALSPAEAIDRAKIATRQYAKRQSTWFRNQLAPHWRRIRGGDAGAVLH